jgi:chromosome segregation ATPase
MLECGISSIFTIIVDNASANDTAIEYLKRRSRDKVAPYWIMSLCI